MAGAILKRVMRGARPQGLSGFHGRYQDLRDGTPILHCPGRLWSGDVLPPLWERREYASVRDRR